MLNCVWCSSGGYGVTPLLPLLPDPLCPGVVVSVKVPSIGQIDLFKIIFKLILNFINILLLKTLKF